MFELTLSVDEIQTPFWDVNNKKCRKWCKFASPLLFNNNYGLPVLTKDTKCPNQVFYVWLVEQQNIWAKFGLETWIFPNNDIRKCLLDIKHGWTKNAFWDLNKKKWRKSCMFVSPFLINNTYVLPVLIKDTKCPNLVS
jgi:hypothetical protein